MTIFQENPISYPMVWDLSDLYPPDSDSLIDQSLEETKNSARTFQSIHQGKLGTYEGTVLGEVIMEYESLSEELERLSSYAELRYAADINNPSNGQFLQKVRDSVGLIGTYLVFFTLELGQLEESVLEEGCEGSAQLRHYRSWVRNLQQWRPYQRSLELERFMYHKKTTGVLAWQRLFDETLTSLRFNIDAHEYTLTDTLNLFSDVDQSMRRKAGEALGTELEKSIQTFSLITNTLIQDKTIEDSWRGYPSEVTERHLSNCIEESVVEGLMRAVKEFYPRLSHRYYALKAGWFGGDRLDYWDRNAPLPDVQTQLFSWDKAVEMVLTAYREFLPIMADRAEFFFTDQWIDAQIRTGKVSGGFCHPTVPGAHPYILMNFHGRPEDVMTLAHELGHGIHQMLSSSLGLLCSQTPYTFSEIASVFGEMLTFQSLLQHESDPNRRLAYLVEQVERKLNTVVRQIAFFDFEKRLHGERRTKGEMSAERIGEIWLEVQYESLGPALRFDETFRHYWAYIPHFIHSPFYVYSYAFGDCLVNSLFAYYQKQEYKEDFQTHYLEVLKAGGTKRHPELFAPFGFNLSDPVFWYQGLEMIEGFIDKLEAELAGVF